MYYKRYLSPIIICLGVVFNREDAVKKANKSITNDFEEVENFLNDDKSDKTIAFSPLSFEIVQQMDSYIASNKGSSEDKKTFSSIREMLKSIEDDKSLFLSNKFNTGHDCVLYLKAGFAKIRKENEPLSLTDVFENDMRNIYTPKEIELDFRNIDINSCKSTLLFNGDLKNIFNKSKTYCGAFNLGNNTSAMREFMSASKLINVYNGKVNNNKKFYVTILPYNVENSERFLVHLIPMEDGIDLKELWSEFRKISDDNFEQIMKLCKEKHVKLTVPKIKNLKSCVNRKLYFKSDEKFEVDFVQENYLTIDEGNLSQTKKMRECQLDMIPIFKIEIKANRPYLAFVYDSKLDKIIFVLKDLGTQ